MQSRGALIVLEGCDRAGKTTQCKQLGLYNTRTPNSYWIGFVMEFIGFFFYSGYIAGQW